MTPYNKITAKEQLLERIKDGKLSVGCYLNYLVGVIKLISPEKTELHTQEIEVTYSCTYGKTTKMMFI